MKSLFNKYVWLQLILSILLLFGGAVIIAFAIKDIKASEHAVNTALNVSVAVILFLFGGFAILASLVFEPKKYITTGLLYGSASIALGVMLCMEKVNIIEFLVYLLAVFLIVVGTVELIKAIAMTVKRKNYELYRIIIAYVVAVLFIAGGIVSLIPNFTEALKIPFCIIAGVLLIVAGVFELFFGIKAMVIQIKANKNKEKKEPVTNEQPQEAKPDVVEQPQEPEVKELDYTSNQIEQK